MPRLIDADALKKLIKEFRNDAPQSSVRKYVCDVILSMLGDENQTPTIEAEPVKHGRWKKIKKEKMYCDWEMNGWFDYPMICTNCKYDATEYGTGETPYCPNCGARMDGDAE